MISLTMINEHFRQLLMMKCVWLKLWASQVGGYRLQPFPQPSRINVITT